jgi:hypothetical protein
MKLTEQEEEKLYDLSVEAASRIMEYGATSVIVIACSELVGGGTGMTYALKGSDFEVRDALRRRLKYMDIETETGMRRAVEAAYDELD